MNEKKLQLLNVALKHFALKGYHATSIQEIVAATGIAKGSFYFYFKSKEDMLLSALMHNFEQLGSEVSVVDIGHQLSERERFCQQLAGHFRQNSKQQDFITVLMNEQIININDEIKTFIYQMRKQSLDWLSTSIQEIYGLAASTYALDAAVITQAMCNEYIRLLFSETYRFDPDELANYIVDILDDVVNGMLQKQSQPMLNERNLFNSLKIGSEATALPGGLSELQMIRNIAANLDLNVKQREGLFSYLLVLENELFKSAPQPLIVESIITYLNDLNVNEIKPVLQKLKKKILMSGKDSE